MLDAIVVGLGAMGSSTVYQLALRGQKVLGIDQFTPPHSFGSSHGKTRIIREAYFEDPLYVPLVKRAYNGWAELQARSGKRVLSRTGGLMIGPRDGIVVSGARASAVEHKLPYEELGAAELRARFPALTPPDDAVAIWEPRAGALDPEAAIDAQLSIARAAKAELRFGERVTKWNASENGVQVTTFTGTYTAARLVICAGSWVTSLLPELALPLTVERQPVCWFDPLDPAEFTPNKFPIFIHEYAPGRTWYGFANFGDGVKAALHHQGETTTPQTVRRAVDDAEVATVRGLLERFVPRANGALRSTTVCLYTNAPDEHFILDTHPAHPEVFVASPCSGHGFKFSIAIGELIADELSGEKPRFDLAPFRLARFARATGA
ncbi:MAG TPA: N-methyl-L-tryptophan oxidase [Gemmatimonadaceae bacterium]|nr:N-methyl-L-tryptophan oxidase [Gemmatimonadaceae bacterium]